MDIIHIALANLKRKPARTAAISLGLCALTAMLVAISIIHMSVDNAIEIGGARLGADAMVVPEGWEDETMGALLSGGPTEFYMKAAMEDKARDVEGVKDTAAQLFVISAPLSCCTVSDTMLVGFDPDRDFTITPWLRDRFDGEIENDQVIVGHNILAEPEGRIKFYGKEFLIVGKLEPTGMRYIDSSVFVPMEGVRAMIAGSSENALKTLKIEPGDISAILVRFDRGSDPDKASLKIEHFLDGVKVVLANKVLHSAKENLSVPTTVMTMAVAIQWAVSLVLIGVLYSMSISEREKEIGVMRAAGARSSDIVRLFLYEVLLISGAGGLAGIIIGLAFVVSFQNLLRVALDVPFLLPSYPITISISIIALLLAVLTSVLATFRPISKISAKPPYDSMREGG